MKIKGKILTKLILSATLCSILALLACTKSDKEKSKQESEPKQVAELTFRITWPQDGGRGQAINEIVKTFNQQNSDINVTMIGGNEKAEEIITTLNSNQPPEIFQMPYRLTRSLGAEGYWVKLNSDFSADLQNYYPSVAELGSVNGQQYGIPWIGHSMAFVYNKDMTDKAGIDISAIKTWDDFTAALEAVEAANPGAKGIGIAGKQNNDTNWMSAMFLYSFGGKLVSDDGKSVALNTPEAQAGLNYYFKTLGSHAQEGWQEHSGVDVMGAFRDQKVAFEIQGPWGVTDIWKNGNPFTVAAFSPTQIENGHAEIGPHMLTIPSNLSPEKQSAAKTFIRYIISKDALNMIMKGEYDEEKQTYYPFRVPVRKDMADTAYFSENPEFLPFIEGFSRPSIELPVPAWEEVKEKYYLAALNAIATGSKTVGEATAEIEEVGNSILNR